MTAGRPTDYTQELVDKARGYLVDLASSEGSKLPQIAGLADWLGVSRSTIYLWAKEHEEFSDIFEYILTKQEEKLIDSGLTGAYNSTITKLMLTKHGYTDKADITSDGKALPTPLLNVLNNESNEEAGKAQEEN